MNFFKKQLEVISTESEELLFSIDFVKGENLQKRVEELNYK